MPSLPRLRAADRREQARVEGLRAVDDRRLRAAVGMHVGELARQVADAVGAGERRDRDGAEDAGGLAGLSQEAGPGVTRDARGQRVERRAPAVAVLLYDDALL